MRPKDLSTIGKDPRMAEIGIPINTHGKRRLPLIRTSPAALSTTIVIVVLLVYVFWILLKKWIGF